MDLNNLTLFQMAMTKMEWASQRQKILAQNVANIDTPDYKEHDLKKLDFKHLLQQQTPQVKLAETNPLHQSGTVPPEDRFRANRLKFEESPDGNAVSEEDQMQKVGETQGQYSTAVTLMQAQMTMLKTAIDKGGS
jgi:flagellar basal-body rod protein FlgB